MNLLCSGDLEKAAAFLRQQEEKLKIKDEMKTSEMMEQELELKNQQDDPEKSLKLYQNLCLKLEEQNRKSEENYNVLIAEHEKREKEATERCAVIEMKLVELNLKEVAVEKELEDYKRMCRKLEQEMLYLQEKVVALRKELKRKEQEENGRRIQQKEENRNLECSKNRIVCEIDHYKKRCGELAVRVLELEEENFVLQGNSGVLNIGHSLEGYARRLGKQLPYNEEGKSDRNVYPPTIIDEQAKVGDGIMISNSEDETDTSPIINSDNWQIEAAHVSSHNSGKIMDNGKEGTSQDSSERNPSDQRTEDAAKENSSPCVENCLSYSSSKRKRKPNIITSGCKNVVVDVSYSIKTHKNGATHQTCASCKHQRHRCSLNCPFAPYFPLEKSDQFQAVYKVFGVSNLQKMMSKVDTQEKRALLIESLIWEAEWRQREIVEGCFAGYKKLEAELNMCRRQAADCVT